VRKALNSGWFSDRVWLGQVDAVFARLYFSSMNAHINRDFSYVLAEVGLTAADDFAIAGIDAIAAGTALMIRTVFASPSSAARDAWCATHHG
jgi:hypothetical protein